MMTVGWHNSSVLLCIGNRSRDRHLGCFWICGIFLTWECIWIHDVEIVSVWLVGLVILFVLGRERELN